MRRIQKYKLFSYFFNGIKVPLKLIRFKRPKWKRAKFYIFKNINIRKNKILRWSKYYLLPFSFLCEKIKFNLLKKRKKRTVFRLPSNTRFPKRKKYGHFANPFKIYVSLSKAPVLKQISRERTKFRKILLTTFGGQMIKSELKNQNRFHILTSCFYKMFYMPYHLLWYFKFVTSVEEASQMAESQTILLNDKYLIKNYMLKQGDILSLKSNSYKFKTVNGKYLSKYLNVKTVFADYYTQDILVLNDFKNLNLKDLSNVVPRSINLKYLK